MLLAAWAVRADAPLPVLYAVLFCVHLCTAFFRPARTELLSHLARGERLKRLNSADQTLTATAAAAGLAAGGAAWGVLGPGALFAADALTFLLAWALLLPVRPGPAPAPESGPGLMIGTTLRRVAGNPALRYLTGGEALFGVAAGTFTAMFVVYVSGHLGAGPAVFGALQTVRTLASVAVGFLLGAGFAKIDSRVMSVTGHLGTGAALAALGFAPGTAWAWPAIAAAGAANMLYFVGNRTLLQTLTTPAERIRVLGLESASGRVGFVAGAAGSGLLLEALALPAAWSMRIPGFLLLVLGLWGARVLLRKDGGDGK